MDLSDLPLWQRRNWAADVSTSSRLLVALAADPEAEVRALVAENTWAPPEVLTELASDRSVPVRAAVAANPRTPRSVREELSVDAEARVRRQAS